jgi:hypothetical protein
VRVKTFVVLMLVAGCAAALPVPAVAGRASGGGLSLYEAAPGEQNRLQITTTGLDQPRAFDGSITYTDPAGVVAGAGCVAVSPTSARCSAAMVLNTLVRLGDGNDSLTVTGAGSLRAFGDSGDDNLTGGANGDELDGGAGRDRLRGAGGPDELRAGRGRETDSLSGGAGRDVLDGNDGANVLDGGSGIDRMRAAGGRDLVKARDRGPDEVYCGRGRDRAQLDGLDWFFPACERVAVRRAAAAVPLSDFSAQEPDAGVPRLTVGCPADGPRTCRGRVDVDSGRTHITDGRFAIRRGRLRSVALKAPRSSLAQREYSVRFKVTSLDRRGRRVSRSVRGTFSLGPAS